MGCAAFVSNLSMSLIYLVTIPYGSNQGWFSSPIITTKNFHITYENLLVNLLKKFAKKEFFMLFLLRI